MKLFPRHLLLIAVWVMLPLWFSGCATLPSTTPPDLSIVSIEPLEVTPLEQTYQLKVRLQNPNDHPLQISGMSYVLEVNGQPLLKGVSSESVTVPRFGESVIELSGVSTLFGFVRQLQALQDRSGQDLHYKLRGKVGLQDRFGSLPFSYEGTLASPTGTATPDAQ